MLTDIKVFSKSQIAMLAQGLLKSYNESHLLVLNQQPLNVC